MVVEREVEVEEFEKWVTGMDVTTKCEWRVESISGKHAKLNTEVNISTDFCFFFSCSL